MFHIFELSALVSNKTHKFSFTFTTNKRSIRRNTRRTLATSISNVPQFELSATGSYTNSTIQFHLLHNKSHSPEIQEEPSPQHFHMFTYLNWQTCIYTTPTSVSPSPQTRVHSPGIQEETRHKHSTVPQFELSSPNKLYKIKDTASRKSFGHINIIEPSPTVYCVRCYKLQWFLGTNKTIHTSLVSYNRDTKVPPILNHSFQTCQSPPSQREISPQENPHPPQVSEAERILHKHPRNSIDEWDKITNITIIIN
jgi:hypothetical protein